MPRGTKKVEDKKVEEVKKPETVEEKVEEVKEKKPKRVKKPKKEEPIPEKQEEHVEEKKEEEVVEEKPKKQRKTKKVKKVKKEEKPKEEKKKKEKKAPLKLSEAPGPRHFKLIFGGAIRESGRFSGSKPKQAASKALSTIVTSQLESGEKNVINKEFHFSLKECTRWNKRKGNNGEIGKIFSYRGMRVPIDPDPKKYVERTVTVKGADKKPLLDEKGKPVTKVIKPPRVEKDAKGNIIKVYIPHRQKIKDKDGVEHEEVKEIGYSFTNKVWKEKTPDDVLVATN